MNGRRWTVGIVGSLVVVAAVLGSGHLGARGAGMEGVYRTLDGRESIEFRGRSVYITGALGAVVVTGYEVDGDLVVIRGAGGAQVFHRVGSTLTPGLGVVFVKVENGL